MSAHPRKRVMLSAPSFPKVRTPLHAHAHTHAHTHACTHKHTNAKMHRCTHAQSHKPKDARMLASMHAQMHARTNPARKNPQMHALTHAHTHTHQRTRTHAHARMHACAHMCAHRHKHALACTPCAPGFWTASSSLLPRAWCCHAETKTLKGLHACLLKKPTLKSGMESVARVCPPLALCVLFGHML